MKRDANIYSSNTQILDPKQKKKKKRKKRRWIPVKGVSMERASRCEQGGAVGMDFGLLSYHQFTPPRKEEKKTTIK